MGGMGSGNWHRSANAKLVGHYPRVDIRHIIGTSGQLPIDSCSVWSYLSDKSGVLILPPEDAVPCGGWIKFAFTDCNFGGRRRWLVCPRCKHRRGVIFVTSNHGLACRECLDLRYPSQYGSHIARIFHRTSSLERKLLTARKTGRLTVDIVMAATQLEVLRAQVLSQLDKLERG